MSTQPNPSPHANAFDHIRLIAAFMVLITHQFGVLKISGPWPLEIIGAWGVDIFFGISGYLNGKSIMANRAPLVFLASRALRIYPALILCVVFMVLLGAAITVVPMKDYFNGTTFEFFWRNAGLLFGQRTQLPEVFLSNPVTGLNASLWTLPHEGRLYLYLAAFLFVVRYQPKIVIAAAAAICIYAIWHGFNPSYESVSGRFGILFMTGVTFAAIERAGGRWLAAVILVLVAGVFYIAGAVNSAEFMMTVVCSVLVGNMYVPERFQLPLDISYGFYLFAFPIQQLFVWAGLGLYSGMALSALVTAAIAIFSAVFVERPALVLAGRLKRFALQPPMSPPAASDQIVAR